MRKILLALSAATLALPAPAMARHHHHHHDRDRHVERVRVVHVYDSRGRYIHPHRLHRYDHVWRGHDGRYYCRRDNGTTGLVIGAGVGALLGHELARGSDDRTLATIIGAVGGGLLGKAVDEGDIECR